MNAGNDAVVQILLEYGVSPWAALDMVFRLFETNRLRPAFFSSRCLEAIMRTWTRHQIHARRPGLAKMLCSLIKNAVLLPADPLFWVRLLEAVGVESLDDVENAVLPQSVFATKQFAMNVLKIDNGWHLLPRFSTELQLDEELLLTALRQSQKVIQIVLSGAWSNKLALAALEHENADHSFLRHLDAREWSEELAFKACLLASKSAGMLRSRLQLIPKPMLNMQSFAYRILPIKHGFEVMEHWDEGLLNDQDVLSEAVKHHKEAAQLVPPSAWSTKLALVAAEKGNEGFFPLLPAADWTEELRTASYKATCSWISLCEVLPEHLWTETMALELMDECPKRAVLVPRNLWSDTFTLQVAHRCYQALVYSPYNAFQCAEVREQLADLFREKAVCLRELLKGAADMKTLVLLREVIDLATQMVDPTLFKEELSRSLPLQRAAVNLQLRFSMLAGKCYSSDSAQNALSLSKLSSNACNGLPQWKLRHLSELESPPQPCKTLICAIYCVLEHDRPCKHPDWAVASAIFRDRDALVKKICTFDVSALPISVAASVAGSLFLPYRSSGRSLMYWAMGNYCSALCLSALATWLIGILRHKVDLCTQPCESMSEEVCNLQDQLASLHEYESMLGSPSSTPKSGDAPSTCIAQATSQLSCRSREQDAIVEVMEAIEEGLPSFIQKERTSGNFSGLIASVEARLKAAIDLKQRLLVGGA
eukprot:TRINITY_DN40175_c0_g1_i1.p1 TRINITY_DN40175_c0_g1~~TRINITY_DN40175_c0_g1_i1.p1  ORF type:complete len:818 (-),score=119.95 TRINITY_DN40175_c0_g1_i1:265-2388(-)